MQLHCGKVAPSLLFLFALAGYADSVTTYTDQAAFLAAAKALPNTSTELETFSGPKLTAPGLSVSTFSDWPPHGGPGYGHIAHGVWEDCVGRNCDWVLNSQTTWSFAQPIYAFGATFDYEGSQYDPGAIGLSFGLNWINPPLQNGFFGLVSDYPISSLLVTENVWRTFPEEFPYWAIYREQAYTMDNLYLQVDPPMSSAPEPAALWLLGLGLASLILVRHIPRWL